MKPAWMNLLTVVVILFCATGCGPKSTRGESCAKTADCEKGLSCVDQTCRDVMGDARDKTLDHVNWMRTSESAEHAMNDAFVAAPACPMPAPTGMDPVSFYGCKETWPKGFMQLPSSVRCQYSIEVDNDAERMKRDFTVKAICDFDGDGERAVYVATRHDEAKAKTPLDVY